jgi:hypothetical protein
MKKARHRRERQATKAKDKRQALEQRKKEAAVARIYAGQLPPFLSSDEYAALRHVDRRTIERERMNGSGCAFVKVGGKVLYETAVAIAFLRSTTRTSTSAPEATP